MLMLAEPGAKRFLADFHRTHLLWLTPTASHAKRHVQTKEAREKNGHLQNSGSLLQSRTRQQVQGLLFCSFFLLAHLDLMGWGKRGTSSGAVLSLPFLAIPCENALLSCPYALPSSAAFAVSLHGWEPTSISSGNLFPRPCDLCESSRWQPIRLAPNGARSLYSSGAFVG